MKLLYQTHSPYARKVLVAAHEMGLQQRLSVIHHETSPTRRNEDVFALNPLGKVPVLICDDGAVLFDSNVICEYLDGLHAGAPLIPAAPDPRFRALKIQALAQGIADAGIAARWEAVRRPARLRWPTMHDAQVQKIAQACDFLEREIEQRGWDRAARDAGTGPDAHVAADGHVAPDAHAGAGAHVSAHSHVALGTRGDAPSRPPDIGDIALATALSWLEFREVYAFLPGRPRLAAWYAALCARPSMLATTLAGDTRD
jgi:glutathione S-transferase